MLHFTCGLSISCAFVVMAYVYMAWKSGSEILRFEFWSSPNKAEHARHIALALVAFAGVPLLLWRVCIASRHVAEAQRLNNVRRGSARSSPSATSRVTVAATASP
jgi:hypothetical protein